ARPKKQGRKQPQYFGPGLWFDKKTGRIHCRLAPTRLPYFGKNNYRGETDPRKLRLIVAGCEGQPLHLQGVSHVRLQDLVLRGSGRNTLLMRHCRHVEIDRLTLYVADVGLRVETSGHLRVHRTAFRGPSPPWGSRSASKYRAFDSHLFVPIGTYETLREKRRSLKPQCHDFEISFCEFTDGHDGPYIGGVQRLTFHHNLVENMNDDGVYLSAWGPPGSEVRVFQNRIAQCLTTFAFGLGRGSESDPGTGTWIFRNLIDLRAPVPYHTPRQNGPQTITSYGRLCGDHGGPVWEPIWFYHNTVIARSGSGRSFGFGMAGHIRRTRRRVFNNLFLQVEGTPLMRFPRAADDFQSDGNLCWSYGKDARTAAKPLADFRQSKTFQDSQRRYRPGWEAGGMIADPRLLKFTPIPYAPLDVGLKRNSPAVNAGVILPRNWPDPLRPRDKSRPDIGVVPLGVRLFEAGIANP
ncbi:MAG: hypothetical protein IID45_13955, partial [Planctomycetes bacterium]|nr:hypothetical protein [Planctomycetota bacterium]